MGKSERQCQVTFCTISTQEKDRERGGERERERGGERRGEEKEEEEEGREVQIFWHLHYDFSMLALSS